MTIAERAKRNAVKAIEYACGRRVGEPEYITNLFIQMATEQKSIDEESYTEEMRKLNEEWEENLKLQRELFITRTCEWLKGNINSIYWAIESPVGNIPIGDHLSKMFREAIGEDDD